MNDITHTYLTKLVFLSTIPDWKKISSCNKLLYFIPFESDIWIYPCVEQAITFTDGDNYLPITKYDGTIWIGHEQSSISTLQISLKFHCLTLFLFYHYYFIFLLLLFLIIFIIICLFLSDELVAVMIQWKLPCLFYLFILSFFLLLLLFLLLCILF